MISGRTHHGASQAELTGAFLVGICVAFPTLMPGVANGNWPRSTDLLSLFSVGALGLTVLKAGHLHHSFRTLLLIWAMTLSWVFMEILALEGLPDPPVQRLLIRWLLSGFSAFLVVSIVEQPALRSRFLAGLLAGTTFSACTVLYDFLTFSPEDMPVDELVTLAIYDGKDIHDFIYRASGVFGHPNGAAGCVLLGVPVLIGAIQEGRWPRWSIVLAIALIGGVFYLTKSRGPLAVSAALIAYWLWFQFRRVRVPVVLGAIAVSLAVLAAGGLSGQLDGGVLVERFLDMDGISVNAGDRWWTIATSLELVLHHPLGMGSAYVAPLETATGTSATHNAYLELALMGGVPLMVLIVVRLVKVAALLATPARPVEAWLAAYLLGIFAFESYFLQVNIQLIALWLVMSPLKTLRATQARATRVPGRYFEAQADLGKVAG